METTKVFSDLLAAYTDPAVRGILLEGGARSSKTFSSLQLLDRIARKSTIPRLISCVSETMPHLRRGAITDFKNILETDNVYDPNAWHDTNKMYTYGKGKLEFFSVDDSKKVLGPARQVLYMNEGINISDYDIYRQLAIRTTEKIIIDYNPAFEFWAHTKLQTRPDFVTIRSTYLDNDMLSAAQIAEIESNRDIDPEWFNIYGRGLLGSKKGLVVQNWDIVNELPPRNTWKHAYIGIDFGWSAPSAVMLIVVGEMGEVWIDQLLYARHQDTTHMAAAIKENNLQHLECICDEAEPRTIKDLKGQGIKAIATKTKEIALGIAIMNRFKKHYTARSIDSIYENRNYRYPTDEKGELGSIPIKANGHAKDAERYVFLNKLSNISAGFGVTVGRAKK